MGALCKKRVREDVVEENGREENGREGILNEPIEERFIRMIKREGVGKGVCVCVCACEREREKLNEIIQNNTAHNIKMTSKMGRR
jgi:hypothetical protein